MDKADYYYRKMPFQVKYKKDLNVIEKSNVSFKTIANHFAQNGYENLYLTSNGKLCSIITIDDFLTDNYNWSLERDFIKKSSILHSKKDIIDYFISNPHLDRISIIENCEILCEVDGLIELPLQNGTAKNLVALRYIDYFTQELFEYFKSFKSVLLISDRDVYKLFAEKFPFVSFDWYENIDSLSEENAANKYDGVLDFVYCKNIRKTIGFSPSNLINFSQIMTRFAVMKIHEYCEGRGVHTRFYRLQNYNDLTCLNGKELSNCVTRKKVGHLVQDDEFLNKFVSNENEKEYLKGRMYHASLRLDNGYCFVQDECNEKLLNVHCEIRKSYSSNSDEAANNIHFYGPCTTYGFLLPDDETIPSLVKKELEKKGLSVNVFNHAGIHGYNELNAFMIALNTPVKNGDYFIFYDTLDDLDISEYPEVIQAFEWFNKEKTVDDIWFFDFPGHCNLKANNVIVNHILDGLEKELLCEDKNNKKYSYHSFIDRTYNCFDNMRFTHSSCIKFFRMYKDSFFKDEYINKIGALIIPDTYSCDESFRLIKQAVKECDALYILKHNVNLDDINQEKKLFENTSIEIDGIPARVMNLGYFFDSSRYLPCFTGENDCFKEYLFTEKVLAHIILRDLGVKIRLYPSEGKGIWHLQEVLEIYKKLNIEIKYL